MSKNKSVRQELERIYGKGCFFERAHCAERIEKMGGIKTFKVFVKEKRFKGKPISCQITYHHLKHKSEGGSATVENGANVKEIAHQYIHSLPRNQEEVINDMLREFKLGYTQLTPAEGLKQSGIINIDFDIKDEDSLIIPVYDCTQEEFEQFQKKTKKSAQRKKEEKLSRHRNPTRAMKKREMKKIIEEEDLEL